MSHPQIGDRLVWGAVLALAGCLDLGALVPIEPLVPPATTTPSETGTTAPQIHDVLIDDLAFTPDTLEIRVGDTVRWTMEDAGTFHFVVEGPPRNDIPTFESPRLDVGDSWELVFEEPGDYVYHCSNHSTVMRGATVTVVE